MPPDSSSSPAAEVSPARGPRSVYVTMRDGVRLAVDVLLPAGAHAGLRVPAVVQFTRYWRSMRWSETPPPPAGFSEQEAWLARGYARINVDARGSGASFGVRRTEYSAEEVADQQELIAWIARQPWSNGAVAALGTSYSGNAAELAQVGNPAALRAVIPRFTDFDWYEFILFPGGLRNVAFGPDWGQFIAALDAGLPILPVEVAGAQLPLGVRPVDDDADLSLLDQALAEHAGNQGFGAIAAVEFRDDAPSGEQASANPVDMVAQLEAGARPAQHWASWFDSATAAGALARFHTLRAPMELIIGSWNHGAAQDGDPFLDDEQRLTEPRPLFEQMADFLDRHMASGDVSAAPRRIRYKTLNERPGIDAWRDTPHWPPTGVRPWRWHARAGAMLSPAAPTESEAWDEYEVDFEHGTGRTTRWTTSMSGPVRYPDRADADRRLLTYTSAPLEADLRITGTPLVTLNIACTHDDAALIVYLEHVAPDGRVRYLTEGQLRARSRAVLAHPSPIAGAAPVRSFARADAAPLVPGEVTEIVFALNPIAVLLRAGERLRIAIAGADRDSFERVPASGDPHWQLHRSALRSTYIDLPIHWMS